MPTSTTTKTITTTTKTAITTHFLMFVFIRFIIPYRESRKTTYKLRFYLIFMRLSTKDINRAVATLATGGIVVMPTDTVYGILGSALDPKVVARIYRLRHRNPKKPMIVLIANPMDIRRFEITLNAHVQQAFRKYWPGKVSMVLPMKHREVGKDKFKYLHRGSKSIAFRMPRPLWLRRLLRETGPLVAPSANPKGKPAAKTIREARRSFGAGVDYYLDGGRRAGKPSLIIDLQEKIPVVLRK